MKNKEKDKKSDDVMNHGSLPPEQKILLLAQKLHKSPDATKALKRAINKTIKLP